MLLQDWDNLLFYLIDISFHTPASHLRIHKAPLKPQKYLNLPIRFPNLNTACPQALEKCHGFCIFRIPGLELFDKYKKVALVNLSSSKLVCEQMRGRSMKADINK